MSPACVFRTVGMWTESPTLVSAGAKARRPPRPPSPRRRAIQGRFRRSSRIAPSASPASAPRFARAPSRHRFGRRPRASDEPRSSEARGGRILHRLERRRQDGEVLPSRPRVVRPPRRSRALQQGAVRPAQGPTPASPPSPPSNFSCSGRSQVPRPGTRRPASKARTRHRVAHVILQRRPGRRRGRRAGHRTQQSSRSSTSQSRVDTLAKTCSRSSSPSHFTSASNVSPSDSPLRCSILTLAPLTVHGAVAVQRRGFRVVHPRRHAPQSPARANVVRAAAAAANSISRQEAPSHRLIHPRRRASASMDVRSSHGRRDGLRS